MAARQSVRQLSRAYLRFAETYYPPSKSSGASEADCIEGSLRPLVHLHGRCAASEFGPRKLKEVREHMISKGWSRGYINAQVGRIKRMFKWAIENELCPPETYHGLQAVGGLRAGRTSAPESPPVRPVPEALIHAVLERVSPPVRCMINLQLLTGMRPGEVCIIRTCDIETTDSVWLYRPSHHKTQHHLHERHVFFGPRAQELVRPFLRPDEPEAFLFSPADAERERRHRLSANRKTPLSCGNVPGSNRKVRPKKFPGIRYNSNTYCRAIKYACAAAFPVPTSLKSDAAKTWRKQNWWHPHRLRHNAATRLRRDFGLDVAQVILGHRRLEVTQVYAEQNQDRAREVMATSG